MKKRGIIKSGIVLGFAGVVTLSMLGMFKIDSKVEEKRKEIFDKALNDSNRSYVALMEGKEEEIELSYENGYITKEEYEERKKELNEKTPEIFNACASERAKSEYEDLENIDMLTSFACVVGTIGGTVGTIATLTSKDQERE